MSSILVGVFDTDAEAEAARSRLLSAGFAPSALSMTGGTSGTTAMGAPADREPHHESGIAHFFKRLFGSDDDTADGGEPETYREAFRRGGHGLSVTTANDAETERAERILNECGAVDIDARSEQWRAEGWQGATSTPTAASGTAGEGTARLQVIDEQLQVGKRTVSRGGVRIFSRMTEVPVEETVTLREEHAEVQRRPVDRPATETDFAAFKEGSVELRESSEEVVVSKSARVVEEVEIGKEVTQHRETVHDTVRRTQVDVERIQGEPERATVGAAGAAPSARSAAGAVSTGGSANLDPITGEPGAHPLGTAVGATAGGVAAGAAIGSVAGPVGTAVGAAAGAVVGGLAGKGVAERVDPTVPTKP